MSWQDRQYARESVGERRFSFGIPGLTKSVTMTLIIINVAVFAIDMFASQRGQMGPLYQLGAFTRATALSHFQLWRFVTYQFLHANLFHLLFNMIALYFFGPIMEQWWGGRRYLAFYLLCGMSGAWLYSVLSYSGVLTDNPQMPLVGASGSIFGILIGAALVAPDVRVLVLFIIPMSMRVMAWILLAYATLNVFTGWHNAGGEAAHLGGAVLGFLLVKRAHALDWAAGGGGTSGGGSASGGGGGGTSGGGVKKDAWGKKKRAEAAELEAEEKEVDRILIKVRDKGLTSLTAKEKETLAKATERLGG